jgi:predicted MFS family arabinose efflux permease
VSAVPSLGSTASRDRLPKLALFTLFAAGFVTVLTESLPAGLLPQIGTSLHQSEAVTGQILTIYAIGTAAAALPLTVLTSSWDRRTVMWAAIAGFVLANSITAVSSSYALTLVVRLIAGLAAGLVWSTIGGYAQALVDPKLRGRAVSIATAGTPAALALVIPAGTFLGSFGGWRVAFIIITWIALLLLVIIVAKMPRVSGMPKSERPGVLRTLTRPGVKPILVVVALFALGHNVIYTYIAPLLVLRGLPHQTEWVLLAFGLAALVSIYLVGRLIDTRHRQLTAVSLVVLAAVGLLFALPTIQGGAVYVVAVVWGLAYGGTPALFLTAAGRAGGLGAGIAQSMMVTLWNVGIAVAGLAGGIVLAGFGAGALGWVALAVAAPAVLIVFAAGRNGFPRTAVLK